MRTPRVFHVLIGVALVAAIAVPAAPALAGIPAGRYAIGDSVMLGARQALIARGFRVNAEVSRQFDDAIRLVRDLAAGGHLPVNVIVHLGTNGLIDGADCDRLVHVAGRERHVWLVTVKVPRDVSRPEQRAPTRLRASARQRVGDRLVRPQPIPPRMVLRRRVPPASGRAARVRGAPRPQHLRPDPAPRAAEPAR